MPCYSSHALLDLAGDFPTGCVLVSLSRTRLLGVSLGDKVPPGVAAAAAAAARSSRGASAMEGTIQLATLLRALPFPFLFPFDFFGFPPAHNNFLPPISVHPAPNPPPAPLVLAIGHSAQTTGIASTCVESAVDQSQPGDDNYFGQLTGQ